MYDKQITRAEREIVQRDAIKLAAGAGIVVERSMLVPLLCARARIKRDGDEIAVEYRSLFGDWCVTGGEIIREMRTDVDFAQIFSKPKATVVKAFEKNPFRRGADFNLTEQCKLLRSDPARAAALKAEAEKEASL